MVCNVGCLIHLRQSLKVEYCFKRLSFALNVFLLQASTLIMLFILLNCFIIHSFRTGHCLRDQGQIIHSENLSPLMTMYSMYYLFVFNGNQGGSNCSRSQRQTFDNYVGMK